MLDVIFPHVSHMFRHELKMTTNSKRSSLYRTHKLKCWPFSAIFRPVSPRKEGLHVLKSIKKKALARIEFYSFAKLNFTRNNNFFENTFIQLTIQLIQERAL